MPKGPHKYAPPYTSLVVYSLRSNNWLSLQTISSCCLKIYSLPLAVYNKDQSSLAKGGIAVASPHNCLFVFARWQHRTDGLAAICNCMFWLGFWLPKSPLPWGSGTSSNNVSLYPTNAPAKWHLNPSNGLSRVRKCERQSAGFVVGLRLRRPFRVAATTTRAACLEWFCAGWRHTSLVEVSKWSTVVSCQPQSQYSSEYAGVCFRSSALRPVHGWPQSSGGESHG